MVEVGEVPINELRSKVVTVEPGIAGFVAAEEKAIRPLVAPVKIAAMDFAKTHEAQPWLLDAINEKEYLDGVVADMRHLPDGQDFILRELQKVKPDLKWYRGGTLRKWGEEIGPANHQYFTPEQLETYIIDGGQNGILGKPSTALNFLRMAPRPNPAFYTLTVDDLIGGLQNKAISIGSEHNYDLNVNEGSNRTAYLEFCRNNLKVQRVKLD